jgi:hypothetical protein
VRACRELADLLRVGNRASDADTWDARGTAAAEAINSVFWDETEGFYRAATVQCREFDVWGSAFAVYLGVATGTRAQAVAHWLKNHLDSIVKLGQLRHLPGGVYWEVAGARDVYQNGAYWAVPVGWLAFALDLADPALAEKVVCDMVRDFIEAGDVNECINDNYANVPQYVASAALPLAGIRAVLQRRAPWMRVGSPAPSDGLRLPILFTGFPNYRYRLWRRTSLTTGNWETAAWSDPPEGPLVDAPIPAGTNDVTVYVDGSALRMFYRLEITD